MIEQGGRGGVADYTSALVRALAARGVTVELATARDHRYDELPPEVVVHALFRYVRDEHRPGRILRRARLGRLANGVLFVSALPALARLGRRADVVHTQGWEYAPLGLLAVATLRVFGATVVQTEHNTFERESSLERTRRLLARLTARTIVHTRADLPHAYADARGHAVVIPHGEYGSLARTGGPGDRERARAQLGIPADAPAVILFGRLRPDKGLADLLRAAAPVSGLHVIVAGEDDGGLAPVAAALRDPRLAGRLHLREGFVEMREAADLFAAADAAVLAYPRASQSGVLLLAYGFARPVVVYPVGGLTEAVEDGQTGWVCARADAEALSAALAQVASSGWEECRGRGLAGQALAEGRFGWEAIAELTTGAYENALGGGPPSDDQRLENANRSARLLFARELAAGELQPRALDTPTVRAALREQPVPARPVRLAQTLRRRRGELDWESAVSEPLDRARRSVLGAHADGPPRFLVRVDEFPHYGAWEERGRYGTDAFKRFHEILSGAGVPYLIAVPPRVSQAPLDPGVSRSRGLSAGELAMLAALVAEGTTIALHGYDHRTRFSSPRRHSELCGLDASATEALLDRAMAELEAAGLAPAEVFVPPFNRFDAAQYAALARRFAIVCGGPESISLLGFHCSPLWRGEAVYLPSYAPLYGHAREVLPAARSLIDRQRAMWAPITLHWGWEADAGWEDLRELMAVIAEHTAPWEELLQLARGPRGQP
jgi:glycosyltransferase involved in cell wall biosynthesis